MKTKQTNQLGFRPIQTSFVIQVKSVYLPLCCSVKDGAVLNISFQRGLQESSTGNFIYHKSEQTNKNVIVLKEQLKLVVILYKAVNSSLYQKKTAKLLLRELIKESTGKYIYQNIGICNISLEQILNHLNFELNITKNGFVVFNNLDGAMLKFSLTATIQKIENTARYLRQDDTCQFLTFDLSDSDSTEHNNELISISEAVFSTPAQEADLSQYPDSSSEEPEHAPGWSVYEEQDSCNANNSNSNSNSNSSPESQSGVVHRVHTQPWPTPYRGSTHNTIMYIDATSRLTSPVPLTPAPPEHSTAPTAMRQRTLSSTSTVMSLTPAPAEQRTALTAIQQHTLSSVRTAEFTQEIHNLYHSALHRQAKQIASLEQRLHAQSIQTTEQKSMSSIELEQIKDALQKEFIHNNGNNINQTTSSTEYQEWLQQYNSIHTEIATLIPFHTETMLQNSDIQNELASLREKISELTERLSSDNALIQQAATIAAQATKQCEEAEEESQFLVTALIDMKVFIV